jgi:probable rRNA maturation factor
MENQFHHANITVMFCDEEEARQYNAQYRDKNYATNVLSFALNEGEDFTFWQNDKQPSLDGDLILCPQVVEKEAAEQGKSTQEHYAHLIVHGTLHLMGHDHIEDDEAQIMESLEIALMNQLGYDNPYLIKEV